FRWEAYQVTSEASLTASEAPLQVGLIPVTVSIAALREGLAEIAPEIEPRLYCMLLPELRRLQAQLSNGLNQIRLRWLEGKIDAGLGRLNRAIGTLSRVREAFAKDDLRYDEAQDGMDLARLYLLKGRTADAKRLVYRMAPVFKSKKVHVEAQKALALFRRAV